MIAQTQRIAQSVRQTLFDLLFPPRCVVCRRADSDWFCAACRSTIEMIMPPFCEHCGRPLQSKTCPYCQKQPLEINGMRAVAFFEGNLRRAIHNFKYEHRPELAPILGSMLNDYLVAHSINVDTIVAVPLHPHRERERGYNQSALLAQALASQNHLPILPLALKRTRITRSQVELNAKERRVNVQDAFVADDSVAGKNILLVDDVCTSGATMDACGTALKQHNAKSVWGLALARSRHPDSLN